MIQRMNVNLEAELNRKYPGRKVWVEGDAIVIRLPMALRKRGGRKEIILPEGADTAGQPKPLPRRPLVAALAKGFQWQRMMETGQAKSLGEIARRERVDRCYVRRILRLATLAPDVIDAMLTGNEPEGLSLRALGGDIPLVWDEQRKALGFGGN
jgi:hypothetical protein